LVAFTVRMKSRGSPFSFSKRANASNGLDEITPPKSNMTARMATSSVPPDLTVSRRLDSLSVDSVYGHRSGQIESRAWGADATADTASPISSTGRCR
jgi:hypothetical protein